MKYSSVWMLNKSKVEFFRRSGTCYSMFKCLWIKFKTTIEKICDAFDLKTIINSTYHSTRWHTFDLWVTKKFRCSPEGNSLAIIFNAWLNQYDSFEKWSMIFVSWKIIFKFFEVWKSNFVYGFYFGLRSFQTCFRFGASIITCVLIPNSFGSPKVWRIHNKIDVKNYHKPFLSIWITIRMESVMKWQSPTSKVLWRMWALSIDLLIQ